MSEELSEERQKKMQAEQAENVTEQPNVKEEESTREPTIEEQLETANAKIAELQDQLLRKIAEFDNYRKRVLKEKTELVLNGGKKTIKAILPVLDDFERGLKTMRTSDDVEAVLQGMELVHKKFMDTLKKEGVEPIETENVDFNVDFHEAIAQIPAPMPEMKGKVIDCTLKGYTMNNEVIRYAQVAVGI